MPGSGRTQARRRGRTASRRPRQATLALMRLPPNSARFSRETNEAARSPGTSTNVCRSRMSMRPTEAAGSPVVPRMKVRSDSAVAPCSSPALIHRRVIPTIGGFAGDRESTASASFGRGTVDSGVGGGALAAALAVSAVGAAGLAGRGGTDDGAGRGAFAWAGMSAVAGIAGSAGITAGVLGTVGGTKGMGSGGVDRGARGN